MNTQDIIRNLKYTIEKYKDVRVDTFQTSIHDMASDCLIKIEELCHDNDVLKEELRKQSDRLLPAVNALQYITATSNVNTDVKESVKDRFENRDLTLDQLNAAYKGAVEELTSVITAGTHCTLIVRTTADPERWFPIYKIDNEASLIHIIESPSNIIPIPRTSVMEWCVFNW